MSSPSGKEFIGAAVGDAADMATEQGMEELSLHERGECDTLNPCRLCDPEDEMPIATSYRDMKEALRHSMIALDDWLNTYAPEFCDEERVKEARKRIMDEGGTLAYIADLQERNRTALGEDV
jgi:hypothetical protein